MESREMDKPQENSSQVDSIVRCLDCKHYKMRMAYAAYGLCNNPMIYQNKIMTEKNVRFLVQEEFGCVHFEEGT